MGLLVAAIAAVVAWAARARVAALVEARIVAQPVPADPQAEREFLAATLVDPSLFVEADEVDPSDFTLPAHQRLWAAIARTAAAGRPVSVGVRNPAVGPPDLTQRPARFQERALLELAGDPDATLVCEELLAVSDRPQGQTRLAIRFRAAALAALIGGTVAAYRTGPGAALLGFALFALGWAAARRAGTSPFIRSGSKVISLAWERANLPGRSPLLADPVRGLRRDGRSPTPARVRVVGALASLFTGGAVLVAWPYGLLAVTAALALGATCLVVALVDADTLYIDTHVLAGGGLTAWALAAVSAVTAGDPRRLLAGVAVAAAAGVCFEGTNRLFRLLRGSDGIGGGDSLLLLATAGIPGALTGNAQLALHSIVAGLLLAGAAFAVKGARGGNIQVGAALGPWLAGGWLAAWAAHSVFL